jgi:hypothetical protein
MLLQKKFKSSSVAVVFSDHVALVLVRPYCPYCPNYCPLVVRMSHVIVDTVLQFTVLFLRRLL